MRRALSRRWEKGSPWSSDLIGSSAHPPLPGPLYRSSLPVGGARFVQVCHWGCFPCSWILVNLAWVTNCCHTLPTFSVCLCGRPLPSQFRLPSGWKSLPFYSYYPLCKFKGRMYKLYIPVTQNGFLEENMDLEETTEPSEDIFFFLICSN